MADVMSELFRKYITEYAKQLGMIVVEGESGLQVCRADGTDCMKLEEWGKSVSALYYVASVALYTNENYRKYAIQQTDHYSCWAATLTTVVGINRKKEFTIDEAIIRYAANQVVPSKYTLVQYAQNAMNKTVFPQDEQQKLSAGIADETLEERLKYCVNLKINTLLKLMEEAYPSDKEKSENAEIIAEMAAQLVHPDEYVKVNGRRGLDRLPEREKRFYIAMHFAYFRADFPSFTRTKLSELLDNGPIIASVNYRGLVNNGIPLRQKLSAIEQAVTREYTSHYVVVVNYDLDTDEVWVINTLPFRLDASLPEGFREYSLLEESMDPMFHRIPFGDFTEMLKSDVKCVEKAILLDGKYKLSASEANSIPFAYMEKKAYTAQEIKKILAYDG